MGGWYRKTLNLYVLGSYSDTKGVALFQQVTTIVCTSGEREGPGASTTPVASS
jgi:hypothetical protein